MLCADSNDARMHTDLKVIKSDGVALRNRIDQQRKLLSGKYFSIKAIVGGRNVKGFKCIFEFGAIIRCGRLRYFLLYIFNEAFFAVSLSLCFNGSASI